MVSDLGVVDSQELVRSGGHVDEVGFALSTLAVKEQVDRLLLWSVFQVRTDNLKQGFSQMR